MCSGQPLRQHFPTEVIKMTSCQSAADTAWHGPAPGWQHPAHPLGPGAVLLETRAWRSTTAGIDGSGAQPASGDCNSEPQTSTTGAQLSAARQSRLPECRLALDVWSEPSGTIVHLLGKSVWMKTDAWCTMLLLIPSCSLYSVELYPMRILVP